MVKRKAEKPAIERVPVVKSSDRDALADLIASAPEGADLVDAIVRRQRLWDRIGVVS